ILQPPAPLGRSNRQLSQFSESYPILESERRIETRQKLSEGRMGSMEEMASGIEVSMGGASFAPKEGRGGTGGLVPKLRLKEDKASVRKGTDVLTLVPKRSRCAVSVRDDDTDKWGADELDEKDEYELALRDPSLRIEVLEKLATFRRNRELCDVVLFVKEREIFAHKVVLAAVSPALFDMFLDETVENTTAKEGGGAPVGGVARSQTSTPPGSTETATEGGEGQQQTPTVLAGKSTRNPMAFFEFESTDFECFEALVNFAYTSTLEISSKKVAELYKTAYSLRMLSVVKACANYLADNLCVANCIGIRKQANFNGDSMLMETVDKFIMENAEAIVNESVEFSHLACVKTRIIVTLDEMRSTGGESIAERALQYFADWQKKNGSCEHPLEALVAKSHLLYVEEDRHLADCAEMDSRSSVGSCEIIQDYKRVKDSNASLDQVGTPTVQHRITGAYPVKITNGCKRTGNNRYSSTESLDSASSAMSTSEETVETKLLAVHQTSDDFWIALVILCRRLVALSIQLTDEEAINKGKTNGNGHSSTGAGNGSIVDPQKAQLLARLVSCTGTQRRPLATMNEARASIGAVFVAGKIIVCGGYDRGDCLKSVEEYDVGSGSWSMLSPMIDDRGRFDTTVLGGKVYAIAGSNGGNDLKSCEMYDRKQNKWSKMKSLDKPRSHNGCAALGDFLYSVGGTYDSLPIKEIERYNPVANEWTCVAPMEIARYQAGVIAWKGLLVATGGCDRWACTDTVEAYDPKTDSWRQLARLRTPRRGCACAIYRDQLMVIGGSDGQQSLASVEILDSPNGTWRPGPSLNTPRANTKAVTTAGGVVYVLGGFNGTHFLNTIELMETELTGWRNWQQSAVVDSVPEEEEESLSEMTAAASLEENSHGDTSN
ncbi:ivns-1, partial [Pristionchus pacificus]